MTPLQAEAAWNYVKAKQLEGETDYIFITNSCFTYVAKVLEKAGIVTPKSRDEVSMEALLKRLNEILKTGK